MNQKRTFSYKEAFKFAFTAYIDNFLTFFIIGLITAALFLSILILAGGFGFGLGWSVYYGKAVSQQDVSRILTDLRAPLVFGMGIGAIFGYILWVYYVYQILRMGFAIYENKPVKWQDFFTTHNGHFSTYFLAVLWYHLKVILGFIAFIIPGVYLIIKYWFTGLSLIDKKTSTVSEDATHAATISRHALWSIFWFWLIIGIINGFSRLAAFFIAPIGLLAAIHAYKQLSHVHERVPEQQEIK